MLLDSAILNGAIDANWVLTGVTVIAGGLFIWILTSIRKDLKDALFKHEEWLKNHEKRISHNAEKIAENKSAIEHSKELVELRLKVLDGYDGEKIANTVIEKLSFLRDRDEPRKK